MAGDEFLIEEYRLFTQSFWKNEELGERRVNFFITLATAGLAAVVALAGIKPASLGPQGVKQIAPCILAGLLAFGIVSYLRIRQRNAVTDEYKRIVAYLREKLRQRDVALEEYALPFGPSTHWLLRGGLLQTVAVINSVILTAVLALHLPDSVTISTFEGLSMPSWSVLTGVFVVSYLIAVWPSRKRGRRDGQTFRAGVTALILNEHGQTLAFERSDDKGSWQLPQGGMKVGEEPLRAVYREIREETGIRKKDLTPLDDDLPLLTYELPPSNRSTKTGRGQVLRAYVIRFEGAEETIDVAKGGEFVQWKWMDLAELVDCVVAFRRTVYEQLKSCCSDRFVDEDHKDPEKGSEAI